ncbi:glycerol channel [Dispira simplex]|nr:glycerol channel [Dispira simplex]
MWFRKNKAQVRITDPYGPTEYSLEHSSVPVVNEMDHSTRIDHTPPWTSHHSKIGRIFERFHLLRQRKRDYLAEFLGTLILVLLGDGVVATTVLYEPAGGGSRWLLISFGFGFGLAMGVFVAGGVSGAHLNPAITVTSCLLRGFPVRKVPGYIISQLIGAYCGAALLFGVYHSSIDHFDGGVRQTTGDKGTAGIFATFPLPWVTVGSAFISEAYGAAVLTALIYAILDERNISGTLYAPLAIGFVLMEVARSISWQTGFAVNPARDLGPRIFLSCVGYGSDPWTASGHYAWVPVVAPFLGSFLGGWFYDFFINHRRNRTTVPVDRQR